MSDKAILEVKKPTEWTVISVLITIAVIVICIATSTGKDRSPVFYEDLAGNCLTTLGVYKPIAVDCPDDVCTIHTMNNFNGVHTFWLLNTDDCTVEDSFNF